MNYRKLYIYLIAVLSVLASCSDDILDTKPLNGYSEIDVFADEALLRNFVNGTYRGFRHPFDDENSLTDGLTDNAYNQHGSAEGTIKTYTRAEVNPSNGEGVTRNLWTSAELLDTAKLSSSSSKVRVINGTEPYHLKRSK